MGNPQWLYFILLLVIPQNNEVQSGYSPGDNIGAAIAAGPRINANARDTADIAAHQAAHGQRQSQLYTQSGNVIGTAVTGSPQHYPAAAPGSGGHVDHRNSYNLLSEAMSQAVSNEFSAPGSGSADGACHADDLDCYSGQDRLSMEAIRTLHRQLDDDDNGNIDLSESDDFLRGELKYDSGYEKRQKAFHFNDDMHISVKELWEAWLRSEVHNWTIEQTTDWLAQSVQLPQYVEIFKLHKVTGAALPRLAVNNMHYVGNVLGIKDPIHKQKIALKAMDVVLFGPPRETGTRWKDYILVTLLLSAIIGIWYAYQQTKNAKRHLRRMAQDMEGLQRAEQSLQEMQKELERARMEQENVASEKMDLERRLKEAPAVTTSNSNLEVQQLKKEIEMLRTELSRAEIELVDNCWAPPPQLQQWLQYTYELESKNHQKKRLSAEKQLQTAREACEKLRKKRSSLVGAFVSTHGKSIDDVDRSIVEARNSLGEVTNELQERLHRWKQIEQCLGLNIVNNNGLQYLESVLYGRNNGCTTKGSRGRMTNSTDDLDDDSIQGMFDTYSRSSGMSAGSIINANSTNAIRDDSSCSDEGADVQSVHFYLGSAPTTPAIMNSTPPIVAPRIGVPVENHVLPTAAILPPATPLVVAATNPPILPLYNSVHSSVLANENGTHVEETNSRHSPSLSSECSVTAPPRMKKQNHAITSVNTTQVTAAARAPLPPPRKSNPSPLLRSNSMDMMMPLEPCAYYARPQHGLQLNKDTYVPTKQMSLNSATAAALPGMLAAHAHNVKTSNKIMVKQHSTASQQSTSSSTSSSVHSAPCAIEASQKLGVWSNNEPYLAPSHHDSRIDGILKEANNMSTASLNAVTTTVSKLMNSSLSSQSLSSTNASESGGDEVHKVEKRKRRLRFPFSHSGSSKKDAANDKKKHI